MVKILSFHVQSKKLYNSFLHELSSSSRNTILLNTINIEPLNPQKANNDLPPEQDKKI